MPIELETFFDFGSGNAAAQANGVSNSPSVVTSPAPPQSDQSRVLRLLAGADQEFQSRPFVTGKNKYHLRWYMWITEKNPSPNPYIAMIERAKGEAHAQFQLTDGAGLSLEDASGTPIASSGNIFDEDTWYRVDLLYTHGDPGAMIVYVGEYGVLGVEVINVSGKDFDYGTGGTLKLRLLGQGFGGNPCTIYVVNGSIRSGVSSVDHFGLDYKTLGYWHDEATEIPNVGDDLDSGDWEAEIPFNAVNYGRYSVAGHTGKVTTDYGGGLAIPGPYGDSRIKVADTIIGGGWLWWYERAVLAANGMRPFCGSIDHSTPDVDGTIEDSTQYGSGQAYYWNVVDATLIGSIVPTRADYFQIGFGTQSPGTKRVDLLDAMCVLLVEEGGSSFQLERTMHRGAARGLARAIF